MNERLNALDTIYAQRSRRHQGSRSVQRRRFRSSHPQIRACELEDGREVINMCANNYLGLGDNPATDSTRRKRIVRGKEATVWLPSGSSAARRTATNSSRSGDFRTSWARTTRSCTPPASMPTAVCSRRSWDREDAVISDELNHAIASSTASAFAKQRRFRYKNNNMDDLEAAADRRGGSRQPRIKLIATDGVFSMDGIICNLKGVCDLADKYHALVMVDDSHAVGFVGKHGRGTAEHCGVEGPCGHHHRHPGQSARRELPAATPPARQGDHRPASSEKPSIPVLQHPGCRPS